MSDERISVVVITRNRRRAVCRTLDRLREIPERPAITVVDNDSDDGTAQAIRDSHPHVELMTPGANTGAVGRNLGVRAARTPYVAFCDDDTWYEPGALGRAADMMDRHPELAVVTGSITVQPSGERDALCDEMARSPLEGPSHLPGHPLLSFLAGVSIVRRTAFLAAGGFSARLRLGGEEELLASDVARAGWHMRYVPEVRAHHEPSPARDPHLRRRHGIRNTLWFTWLRRPPASAARRTARLLVRLPRDATSLLGVADAVRGIPWVARQRDAVPADVERGYRMLEEQQLDGVARSYVS